MNVLTIADALAARYAPGAVTPPAGYPNIRVSTARLPNSIPTSPWVLVMLPPGQAILQPGAVDYELDFPVIFHLAKHTADTARDMAAMLSWLGVLLTQTYADMDLGVSGIRKAYPKTWEPTVATYGGAEFYGWEIAVTVEFRETQAFTS